MGRHDVHTFLKWGAGTGLVAVVPHAIALPPVLAAVLPWVTGVGVITTVGLGSLIGTTKALTQLTQATTQLVDAWEKLRGGVRRARKSRTRP